MKQCYHGANVCERKLKLYASRLYLKHLAYMDAVYDIIKITHHIVLEQHETSPALPDLLCIIGSSFVPKAHAD